MNFKQKQLGIATRSALLTCVVAAGALMVPAAFAGQGNSNGGSACKAAFGDGAKVFYFDAQFAQNTSASNQFLSCMYTDTTFPNFTTVSMTASNIGLANPAAAAQDFTCLTQVGWDGFTPIEFNAQTVNVPGASVFANIHYEGATMPARPSYFAGYVASCLVPPEGKITAINAFFPEPA